MPFPIHQIGKGCQQDVKERELTVLWVVESKAGKTRQKKIGNID